MISKYDHCNRYNHWPALTENQRTFISLMIKGGDYGDKRYIKEAKVRLILFEMFYHITRKWTFNENVTTSGYLNTTHNNIFQDQQ